MFNRFLCEIPKKVCNKLYFFISILVSILFQHFPANVVVDHTTIAYWSVPCGSGKQKGDQYNPVIPVCFYYSFYYPFFNFINICHLAFFGVQCYSCILIFGNYSLYLIYDICCGSFSQDFYIKLLTAF